MLTELETTRDGEYDVHTTVWAGGKGMNIISTYAAIDLWVCGELFSYYTWIENMVTLAFLVHWLLDSSYILH